MLSCQNKMPEPFSTSGVAYILVPSVAATISLVVAPTNLDLLAFCAGAVAAGVCFLLTHERKESVWVRWGWCLLTLAIGGFSPRVLANRGYIQETFADFGMVAIVSGMLIPIALVAVWVAFGKRAPTIAEGLVKRGEKLLPKDDEI